MTIASLLRAIGFWCLVAAVWPASARANDIRVLCAAALKPAMEQLVSEFARLAGHKLMVSYGPVGILADRARKGELVDVIIVSRPLIDEFVKQGRVVEGTQATVAQSGIGVGVRTGTSKPDIGSAEAFVKTMLAAKSVAYPDPATGSPAGIYVANLFERLGITAAMQPKLTLTSSALHMETVVSGVNEIGLDQMNGITNEHGVDLVGPLPATIQSLTPYVAALVAASGEKNASKAFIEFILSPAAQPIIKANGLIGPG